MKDSSEIVEVKSSGEVRPKDPEEARYLSHFHGYEVVPRKNLQQGRQRRETKEDGNGRGQRPEDIKRLERAMKVMAAAVIIGYLIMVVIIALLMR